MTSMTASRAADLVAALLFVLSAPERRVSRVRGAGTTDDGARRNGRRDGRSDGRRDGRGGGRT
ncbi:hypothetical protein ACWEWD_24885, partial [Streptomyces tendae]